ncbi:NADH-dependent flavin oxidoreductase [Teratosphaeriaceae sp. CCFEE 6253]|nr:NADH-dependent flavin oxidoreductase [Teratosphaeriaceae sp. CCFEE 6253]
MERPQPASSNGITPHPSHYNAPFPDIPYFTPRHVHNPATPSDPNARHVPTLFTPLKIRGATLKNRIIVAPMCQYSTAASGPDIGALTPWHIATLGHYAIKGAALVFIEASGVQANGRISPNCPGIWADSQVEGVKAVADFCHSQGALCGIQLAHAGRKASTCPPFVNARHKMPSMRATEDVGGWPEDVVGPSGGEELTWDGTGAGYWPPRELTVKEIRDQVEAWKKAAMRSVRAGVDVIEVHGAHGYLIHQFLSPVSNRRTDQYGGSFENRIRFVVEIVRAIRSVIPESMPLFLRLSATEWLDETDIGKQYGFWTVEDTIALSKIASDLDVDLLDVSSGGNHPSQRINMFESKDYQTRIAARIRRELREAGKGMLIGAVGLITEAEQASKIVEAVEADATSAAELQGDAGQETSMGEEAQAAVQMTEAKAGQEPMADAILVARQFLREPEWVMKVAWKLGVDVVWPMQFNRVRFPKL